MAARPTRCRSSPPPIEVVGPATVASLLDLGLFRIAEVAPRAASRSPPGSRSPEGTWSATAAPSTTDCAGTLTVTGVTGSPLFITGNSAGRGGGIAAADSTATTPTQTAVTNNHALLLLATPTASTATTTP